MFLYLRKEEVRSEARKLLYNHLPKNDDRDSDKMEVESEQYLPDFIQMVLCIAEKGSSRLKSRNAVTYGTRTLPFDTVAFSEVSCSYIKGSLAGCYSVCSMVVLSYFQQSRRVLRTRFSFPNYSIS